MRLADQRGLMAEINVTPFVDVMLVLLIIFMVTAPLLDRGIPVDLPAAASGKTPRGQSGITLTLTKEHVVYFNNDVVTLQELRQRLAAMRDQPVVIRADRNAYVARLVELWDLCRLQGFQQVHIITMAE